jgi:glutamate racemase
MIDSRPIGIFDSGIGGLTVVNEFFNRLPGEDIVYFGDTARVPYGSKSESVVRRFALEDAAFLLKHRVKMIVVACHTATSFAMDLLLETHDLPILGVVDPGIEAALAATRNGKIGVIGTRGTVTSRTYETKLKAVRPDIRLSAQACPLFVPLVEEGWLDTDVTREVARIYLQPMIQAEIDTLILGCTHYPLLKSVIREILGPGVQLIDSAEETAKAAARELEWNGLKNGTKGLPNHRFYVSDIPHRFQEIGERFLGRPLGVVERVELGS